MSQQLFKSPFGSVRRHVDISNAPFFLYRAVCLSSGAGGGDGGTVAGDAGGCDGDGGGGGDGAAGGAVAGGGDSCREGTVGGGGGVSSVGGTAGGGDFGVMLFLVMVVAVVLLL